MFELFRRSLCCSHAMNQLEALQSLHLAVILVSSFVNNDKYTNINS